MNKKLKDLLANVKQEVIEYAFENEEAYETYYENADVDGDHQCNSDLEILTHHGKAYDDFKDMNNSRIEGLRYKIYHNKKLVDLTVNETVYADLDTAVEFLKNCYKDIETLDDEQLEKKYDESDEDIYVEIKEVYYIDDLNIQVLFYSEI